MIRVKILYGGKTSPVVVYPKLALTRKKTQVIVRFDAKNADKPIAVIIERVGDDELVDALLQQTGVLSCRASRSTTALG